MATINVPEYDRQQYETAMQSIKNSTPITTPEPAPTPATTAAKPAPVPILAPTTPEQKSALYGGESISNPDTLNTTVDTIRENVKKFSGVQQVEKELNVDILKLHYPVFEDHIDYARAMGYDDSEIREYLEGRETLARLQHPQHDINAYLQRAPEANPRPNDNEHNIVFSMNGSSFPVLARRAYPCMFYVIISIACLLRACKISLFVLH